MHYRHVLVLARIGRDPSRVFAALRWWVPSAERVTVVAQQPTRQIAWLAAAAPPDHVETTVAALDVLRDAARRTAPDVGIQLVSDWAVGALTEMATSAEIDLVAVDSSDRDAIPLVAELRRRARVAVLYVPDSGAAADRDRQMHCLGFSSRECWAIATFLRDHGERDDRTVLLTGTPLSEEELREGLKIAGVALDIQLAAARGTSRPPGLSEVLGPETHLVVLPRFPPPVLLKRRRGHPVLVLPPARATDKTSVRAIDVPDLVDDGRVIRVKAEYAIGVGRRTPVADQDLSFVSDGSAVARATVHDGTCELTSGLGDSLGVFRLSGSDAGDALSLIEAQVSVLRSGRRPLLLFDAELDAQELKAVREVTWAQPVAVRIRAIRSCRSLRARLRRAGLPPIVIDAGTVLDEGDTYDVPALVDAVRLARTAARMRACGFLVPAIVYRGAHRPSTVGFSAVRPQELRNLAPPTLLAPSFRPSLGSRLDAATGSEVISGNRIEVELDNRRARNWLLDAIEHSERRVHFQAYMALDDDVGRTVEAALATAAARGVTVRVLVDSLHGLHGSFGLRNSILERLSSRAGVELRVGKPITRDSPLEDLKQRDHRKLAVVDGRVALLGGRNLSHEYYSGFEEVPLEPGMTWRIVPWLDAGARVEGPAVAALERSFLQAWRDAGGRAFDIPEAPPAGTAAARVIVHRGLRDAHTVEAYIALIESARSHVYVVNGFPLQLEIQHALVGAVKRGVRVRTLVGNLTPRYGRDAFEGPWAAARTVATSLVHSRMDPVVAAGGECYEFVVPHQPGWDPSLREIRPHVHAKTMSVDGRVCAVGSANLDVTAGYWENELLLVVEEESIAAAVEARFDELLATSRRFDRGDPDWQRRAEGRRWMRYWPGVLSA